MAAQTGQPGSEAVRRVTRAEIDTKALRTNFEEVRKMVGSTVRIMAVVKANAYGHGMEVVPPALARFGVDYFGVGFAEEGIALRQAGITTPILVLGGVLGTQAAAFRDHDLDVTLSSIEVARHADEEVRSSGRGRLSVHLKVDTGMGRLGVRSENAASFLEEVARLRGLNVKGLYTHLAVSDDPSDPFTIDQLARFESVVTMAKERGMTIPYIHVANSGGILNFRKSYQTMVRPGLMLYGIHPGEAGAKPPGISPVLSPVLSLKSRVVFLKEIRKGDSVSYGRKFIAQAPTRIATVPVGYGDGYPRALSGKAQVIISGRRFPIAGTVCMDQIMVDVGSDASVRVGSDVTLIGADGDQRIGAGELARLAGTIPYEVLTGIAARVPRVEVYT